MAVTGQISNRDGLRDDKADSFRNSSVPVKPAHHFIVVTACHEADYGQLIEDYCLSQFKFEMEVIGQKLWCDWDETVGTLILPTPVPRSDYIQILKRKKSGPITSPVTIQECHDEGLGYAEFFKMIVKQHLLTTS
ncbi:hypothetical protein KIL84_012814, partial [Mauremys mutica]